MGNEETTEKKREEVISRGMTNSKGVTENGMTNSKGVIQNGMKQKGVTENGMTSSKGVSEETTEGKKARKEMTGAGKGMADNKGNNHSPSSNHSPSNSHNHSPLDKEKHAAYVLKTMKTKDLLFFLTEPSRIYTIYWALNSLKILKSDFLKVLKEPAINFVKNCLRADGGFGCNLEYPSTLVSTFHALQVLFICEVPYEEIWGRQEGDKERESDYKMESECEDGEESAGKGESDRKGKCERDKGESNNLTCNKTIKYILRRCEEDGSFTNDEFKEKDTRFDCCAVLSLVLIRALWESRNEESDCRDEESDCRKESDCRDEESDCKERESDEMRKEIVRRGRGERKESGYVKKARENDKDCRKESDCKKESNKESARESDKESDRDSDKDSDKESARESNCNKDKDRNWDRRKSLLKVLDQSFCKEIGFKVTRTIRHLLGCYNSDGGFGQRSFEENVKKSENVRESVHERGKSDYGNGRERENERESVEKSDCRNRKERESVNYENRSDHPITSESHAAQIFCVLSALRSLGQINKIDRRSIEEFLVWRQCPNGGINGRVNKKEDVCYSFWAFSAMRLLEGGKEERNSPAGDKDRNSPAGDKDRNSPAGRDSSTDRDRNPDKDSSTGNGSNYDLKKLKEFIFSCEGENGGFSDRKGHESDLYHLMFSLASLSLMGEEGLGEVDPGFAL